MPEAAAKELGLQQPTQQHGVTANDRIEEFVHLIASIEHDTGVDNDIATREKGFDRPQKSNESNALERTQSGVNVEQAQKDFAELSQELSSISRRMSQKQLRLSHPKLRDLENAASASDDKSKNAFDLESTLRGNREAENDAGIRPKYIGRFTNSPADFLAVLTKK